ncbi:MAG TPA: protein-disulfide reductase DsbD domain-containing protein [Methylomirabilota bacterium]|nr:protein-disulfide reductase DsbD domain-containing protein [Methylomirabilota bacterium]
MGPRALCLALTVALLTTWASCAPAASAPASPLVRVELLGETQSIRPGGTFWLALHQRITPGWHTYWGVNPGDAGEPTRIEWALPAGFTAGEIAWPYPARFPVGIAMSYGYEREVVLPIPMTAPRGLAPGTPVTLRGQASWLVCDKICIPEEAPVALSLPVATDTPRPDPRGAPLIAAARRTLPAPSPWPASFVATAETVTLTVAARDLAPERIAEVWFYPARWGAIEHAASQRTRVEPGRVTLEVKRGQLAEATATALEGVLVVAERLDGGIARQAFSVRAEPPSGHAALALLWAMALALAGGLVLNLMPCVLPVLSVKALALVGHASGYAALRRHGLAYTAGVLASFAVVAGALLALRAGGEQIGWGFQLQSPVVVTLLAYVLFAVALSLSGVFTVGGRFAGAGQALAGRAGYAGSFFTGALATVAATPCTAPFMGAAVGYAVTQPWTTALLVFEALALGLALPFLLLTLIPAWRRFVPKPGPWMRRLQQALAFPLYASVAWLLWVVSQQAASAGVAAVLAGLLLIAFAAWLYQASRDARAAGRRVATLAVAALAVGAVALGPLTGAVSSTPVPAATRADGWEPFSPARLAELRAAGRPVFVNVTAAWCLTCLVNERVALRAPAVTEVLARKGVATLRADWTNRDPAITRVLGQFGRNGVPLYLLYPPRAAGEPAVLPQILGESAVIDALDKL